MKKNQDDSAAHELRDRPVPPVKGAVTEPADLRRKPEQSGSSNVIHLGDSGSLDSWM